MEQGQFKVSFSVGTKLLISVVLLLFVVIIFLNFSTIFLLTEDKRAYVYQSQATESDLAGREFVNMADHAIDTLRLCFAAVDPRQPATAQSQGAFQSVLNNQTGVLSTAIEWLDPKTGNAEVVARASRQDRLGSLQLKPEDLVIQPELIKEEIPNILKNGLAIMNASSVSGLPFLGIAFADLKLQSETRGIPVALGFVSLRGFGQQIRGSRLTIATRDGWVIFDTDPSVLFAKKNIADDPLMLLANSRRVQNGAQEYEFEDKRYLGSYTKPGLDLVALSRIEWKTAMRATYALTEKYVLLGLMAIGAAIIFAILFAKTMTAPIETLFAATKKVSAGDFDLDLKVESRDEIGALTGAFSSMAKQIQELIIEKVEKVYLENELAIASTVQQTLIPAPSFKNERIQIYCHYQSASECGGDWMSYFAVGDKMCFLIADATGHGLPSALITASAHSCFSVMHKLAQDEPEFGFSPGAMLSYANRVVHDAAQGRINMTFFVGVVDFGARTLTYANAAHNPPWLFKKEGAHYAMKSLTPTGNRLGELQDVAPFEEKTIEIAVDDILFLYTDGVLEGKNRAGEMYGKKRIRTQLDASVSAGPERMVESLVSDFLQHNGQKPLDDDVTLAAAKILSIGGATS